MKLKNASRWVRNPLRGYQIAIIAYLLAWGLRMLLHPFLQAKYPTFVFFLAVVAIAYRYGFAAAMLCALLSIPTAFYFFVQPFGQWDSPEIGDVYTLVVYLMSIILCVAFLELLNRERYNSELLARVADSRYRMMMHLDEDRRFHQDELRRAAIAQSALQSE